MKVNKKRLQALITWSTLIVLMILLVVKGGGHLLSEYNSDVKRLSDIRSIESQTGKTVGQLGLELTDYCNEMSTTKADERVKAMAAQDEKFDKALGYKSSRSNNYDREREEVKRSAFFRCFNLSDANRIGLYYYEGSGDSFKSEIQSKWIKLSISSIFSIVMVLCIAWVAGNFVVRTIPFFVTTIFSCIKKFIGWITAPEK